MISLAQPSAGSASRQRRTTKSNGSSAQTRDSKLSSGRFRQAIQTVEQNIWLPDSPMTFGFYLITIVVLCGGLFLHINMSARITQTQYDIAAHTSNYYEIERESAEVISQIAIATSMFDIHRRALALGYQPVTDSTKKFVAASEIQVPQPRLATVANTAPNNAATANNEAASITVAQALEADGNSLTGYSSDSETILIAGNNNAGTLTGEPEGLADRLIRWWQND